MRPLQYNTAAEFYEANLKNGRVIFEKPVRGRSRISIQIPAQWYFKCCTLYVGKFWCKKKLMNLPNRMPFTNVLLINYFLLYSLVAIQVVHSPMFYPPIGSDYIQPIRQCFTPPRFSHVWYVNGLNPIPQCNNGTGVLPNTNVYMYVSGPEECLHNQSGQT